MILTPVPSENASKSEYAIKSNGKSTFFTEITNVHKSGNDYNDICVFVSCGYHPSEQKWQ
jgi:hypothetical protein